MSPDPLLAVDDLRVTYAGGVAAARGVSFQLAPGKCLALVGESGCGKTTIVRAILGLLPRAAKVDGSIRFAGRELVGATETTLREVRGREIGLVWQDPFDTFDPLQKVGTQIAEAWRAHGDTPPPGAVADRLAQLGIPDAAQRMRRYPHEWSGGMLQRAGIAAASAYGPRLLLADEPTSALDADRAEATLTALRATGAAVVLVSHDLALVGRHADHVAVCYAGRIVETGPAREVTNRPRHPYSIGLLGSLPRTAGVLPRPLTGSPPSPLADVSGCAFEPRCARRISSCAAARPELIDGLACGVPAPNASPSSPPEMPRVRPRRTRDADPVVLRARGIAKAYGRSPGAVTAVAQADLAVRRGEIVGISGPSGSGKSTLLRLLTQIEMPTAGIVAGPGHSLHSRGLAMAIFQDATGSLDPRWPVWRSVAEPLMARRPRPSATERRTIALDRLAEVGLPHIDPEARPAELSVGQCQRVAIARALVSEPAFLAADEPTSGLDGPVAASIVGLLSDIAGRGTAILVVSHDRALLGTFCDRVLTMRDGVLH